MLYCLLKFISSDYVILVVDTFFSLYERFQDSAAKVRHQQKLTKAKSLKDTTQTSPQMEKPFSMAQIGFVGGGIFDAT